MSSQLQQALDAGYSEEEVINFLSKKDKDTASRISKAKDSGYSPKEIVNFLGNQKPVDQEKPVEEQKKKSPFEPTWERGASVRNSFWKGLGKTATGLASLVTNDLIPQEKANELLENLLPTKEGTLENVVERGAELLPWVAAGPGGAASKLAALAGGTAAGQIAKENEVGPTGQAIAEAVGSGVPGLLESGVKGAVKALRMGSKKEIERLPSGLPKTKAIEAKRPRLGHIAKETQEKAIAKVNKDASELAMKSLEKARPLISKIESGHDFEKAFEKGFGQLKAVAERSNPTIDITPLGDFLSESAKKYRGIPHLHAEGAKVAKEIKAFRDTPRTGMSDLLKIYRSNSQKVKTAFETALVSGKQKEYVDFLLDMNRNIVKSWETTLGEGSSWVKDFKALNAEYGGYKSALKGRELLEPIIGKNPTPAVLEKIASNPKAQTKLRIALGEKGAEEIVQLAKDQKLAIEAIKKIPVKEMNAWEKIAPLGIFIPGIEGIGSVVSVTKGVKLATRVYGNFLTTPQTRKQYNNVLKAIETKDLSAYKVAVSKLLGESEEE